MSVSLTKKTNKAGLFLLPVIVAFLMAPGYASAAVGGQPDFTESRTAGGMPKSSAPAAEDDTDHARHSDARPSEPEAPGTLRQDFDDIEPIGLIVDGGDGGLGVDVWYGSDRAFVTQLLSAAPRITYFPVIQSLLRRLYLTSANPDYFNRGSNRPEPGRDMLTLRLEKLEQMGLYGESIKLYSQIGDVPYHEKLARAGVLSMMQGGKGSLGCLETRTVMNRFGELEFWQTLNAVCDIALSKLGSPSGKDDNGLEVNDIDLSGSGSKVIEQLSRKLSYVYRVRSQEDVEGLSPLERAALQTNNAFVFDRFRFNPKAPVSPAAFGVMLGGKNLSESMRFIVLVKSASHGLKPVSDIQKEYDLVKNLSREKPVGWRQLPALYKQASEADPGPVRNTAILKAMDMANAYGGVYAVTPFAQMLTQISPSELPAGKVGEAVRIMVISGKTVPGAWVRRLAEGITRKSDLLLLLAAELNSDLSTETNLKTELLSDLFKKLNSREKALVAAAYEKLDKDNLLHNYADIEVYEKLIDLTANVDYVMPSSDLADSLHRAFEGRKLGESVLLSAIALQGTQPSALNPGLLREVLGGLRTVGLTKEARALATEVILGLKN